MATAAAPVSVNAPLAASTAAPPPAIPSSSPVTSTAGGATHQPSPAAAGPGSSSAPKNNDVKRVVSTEDIQLVQNLIERCLQLYMSQREVVTTLQQQAKTEPGFTQLVWQKLEEQNPDFFRAYYTRLKLKDQIVLFNHLLEQQVAMVQKMQRAWMQSGPQAVPMFPTRPGMSLQGMHGQATSSQPPAVSLPGESSSEMLVLPDTSFLFTDDHSALFLPSQPGGSDHGELGSSMPLAMPGAPASSGGQQMPDGGLDLPQLPLSSPDLGGGVCPSPVPGGAGSGGFVPDGDHLSGIPKVFSLSDLTLDRLDDHEQLNLSNFLEAPQDLSTLPRNFSLSDMGNLASEFS